MEDEYGEVKNCPLTYASVALALTKGESVMVAWTDGHMSHFDVLFTYKAMRCGKHIQGGVRPETDLLVSVMRVGSFGFEVNDSELHWSYVNEKFGNFFGETTGREFAALVNGIKNELYNST